MAYTSRRSRRRLKTRDALRRGEIEALVTREGKDSHVRAAVYSLLCDSDSLIRQRAAECLGLIAAGVATGDLDAVRELLRRLLWSMNDEAGSLIPHAPQAIGEVLANVPELIDEYLAILASFSETEPLREGVRSALERIAAVRIPPMGRL